MRKHCTPNMAADRRAASDAAETPTNTTTEAIKAAEATVASRSTATSSAVAPHKQSGPFNPAVMGRAAHEVIAELMETGVEDPWFEQLIRQVARHPATRQPTVRRQAAKLWLTHAAASYLRFFQPGPDWAFMGAEDSAPGCRFDLVWQHWETGGTVADELKTGKADFLGGRELDDQLQRQCHGGRSRYGQDFRGVRLLVLAAPRLSRFVAADGDWSPLFDQAGLAQPVEDLR